ncbi:LOW QUALITY PROTEIN: hypothetical protein V1478_006922 [Vespula squamosa]|uniref:Uncharacterized protein n=1 Tax=Vespula squamosa TaxID=30214 RepID=A0ABD2B1Q4_VESSQ
MDHFVNEGFRFLRVFKESFYLIKGFLFSCSDKIEGYRRMFWLAYALVFSLMGAIKSKLGSDVLNVLAPVEFNLGSRRICRKSTTGCAQVVIEALRRCDSSAKCKSVPEYAVTLGAAILAFET